VSGVMRRSANGKKTAKVSYRETRGFTRVLVCARVL
jgi:hypothetical protein